MFRKIRRIKQTLNTDRCIEILKKGKEGVLAVLGDNGYPYTVPLNYVYYNEKIYFHCAKQGHKIDAIAENNKVSFCIIDEKKIVKEEYDTYFRSVVVFGKANIIVDDRKNLEIINVLAERYYPEDSQERRQKIIDKEFSALGIVEIVPEHISGKEAMAFVKARQKNK